MEGFRIALNPDVSSIPYSDRKRIQDATRGRQDLADLASGNPDLPMPPFITERLRAALADGLAPYTSYYGFPELRARLAGHLVASYGIAADPENELLVTHGVQEGLYIVMRSLFRPGDELLLPTPHYGVYSQNAAACGLRLALVRLREEDGYLPDLGELERAITPRTRGLMFCTPNNPLGVVWPREVLEGIAGLARRHDLVVLVDEIYHDFTYVEPPPSFAALPGMGERTFTFGGFSKSYMMMGLRVGWVAGPAEAMAAVKNLHYCVTLCPSYLGQIAALAALDCPAEQTRPLVDEFRGRIDLLYDAVTALPGVTCPRPQGAFYLFPNVSCFGLSSLDLALALIERAGVIALPGTEFGPCGEGHLRLSTCAGRGQIALAAERLARFAGEKEGRRQVNK